MRCSSSLFGDNGRGFLHYGLPGRSRLLRYEDLSGFEVLHFIDVGHNVGFALTDFSSYRDSSNDEFSFAFEVINLLYRSFRGLDGFRSSL